MTLVEAAAFTLAGLVIFWATMSLLKSAAKPKPKSELPPLPPRAMPRSHWPEVLHVPATASNREIRQAYRRLMSQYHPDKVNHLAKELRDRATRKSQNITAAYTEAMRERGELP